LHCFLAAGAIYLVLGDLREAIILAVFASTSVLIAMIQEAPTERVLESLRDLTSPRALVIRDGTEKRIAGSEVVRGDLVILAEGDRVPADGNCSRRMIFNAMNRCSPVKPCLCARSAPQWQRRLGGRAGTTCPMCSPAAWSSAVMDGPRSPRLASAARSVRSASRLRGSKPNRRVCGPKRAVWSASLQL